MQIGFERRVLYLFGEMLDQTPDDRRSWLEHAAAGDPLLIDAVQAMATADIAAAALPTIPPEPRRVLDDAPPPARIGNYRITGELGRGGMGVVYQAERDDGLFEHKVAIKLIRSAVFSQTALDQFATERRILARLRHPRIAQMLDGGVSPDGASYIIMELIGATPITDYCEEHRLPLAARLDLFGQALAGIEHAHRTLIVHADIKPSNVAVEPGFGVKLLDFGIARLLTDAGNGRHGGYTPGYASPARIAGLPPTPTDDVFASGMLLRTLIGGVAGVDADLLAIAGKASAAAPADRYGAVSEFRDDLERWRGHRPTVARPPARPRRAALFWRRNRLALSIGIAVGLLIVATIAATTVLWLRAERARASAEARFDETRGLSRYMLDRIEPRLAALPGSAPLRKDLALQAERMLEHLSTLPNAPRAVQADGAEGSARVGEILSGLDPHDGGNLKTADAALARSEATLRQLIATAPPNPGTTLALARTLIARAKRSALDGNAAQSATRRLDEVDRLLASIAHGPHAAEVRDQKFEADLLRATIMDRDSDYPKLLALLHTMPLDPANPAPSDPAEALRLSISWNYMGDAQYYGGHMPLALRAYRRADQALSAPALATNALIVARRGYAAFALADTLYQNGYKQEALKTIADSVTQIDRLRVFDNSPNTRHMWQIVHTEYSSELAELGHLDAAIRESAASVADRTALAAEHPLSYDLQRGVPVAMRTLADLYRQARREAEACAMLHRTQALWQRIGRRWPLNGTDRGMERDALTRDLAKCT